MITFMWTSATDTCPQSTNICTVRPQRIKGFWILDSCWSRICGLYFIRWRHSIIVCIMLWVTEISKYLQTVWGIN